MKRFNFYFQATVLLLTVELLAGFWFSPTPLYEWKCEEPLKASTDNAEDLSDSGIEAFPNTNPIIVVDETISMEGFVFVRDSEYIQSIIDASRIAGSSFDRSLQYWSFGTEVRINRSLQEIRNPDFYYYSPYQDAWLEKALTESGSKAQDKLYIIFTDMYREKQDLKPLNDKLKDYFGNNISLGLIGVKSQFDGTVHDALLQDKTFYYKGKRPFYIILVGNRNNVLYFWERLKASGSSYINEKQFVFWGNSDNISAVEPVSFKNLEDELRLREYEQLDENGRAYRVPELSGGDIALVVENSEDNVDLLEVRSQQGNREKNESDSENDAEEKRSDIEYPEIPLQTVPYLNTEVQMRIKSCFYNHDVDLNQAYESDEQEINLTNGNNADGNAENPTPAARQVQQENCEYDDSKSSFLDFSNSEIERDRIKLKAEVRNSAESGKVELVTLDILGRVKHEVSNKQIWKEWSYDDNVRNQSDAYYGARTYQLMPLLNSINNIATQNTSENSSEIIKGRFCFAVYYR